MITPATPLRDALSTRIASRLFYGWVMLAVAALGMFASGPGQSHIFSVFIGPIADDLALSRTEVSSAYAFATLVAAFGLPFVGRGVDRFGVRPVMLVVALLLGFAAIGFGHVAGLVTLGLGFMALRFLGQGSLMLCNGNLVSQWFSRRRGFALGLMMLGFSLSVAAHPPLAQWLIERVGWRDAWFWLGILTWLMLVPVIVLLVQNRPEDLGLAPDGAVPGVEDDATGAAGHVRAAPGVGAPGRDVTNHEDDEHLRHRADVGLTLHEAMRTAAFWIIAASLGTVAMLVTALFFYQVQIFESHGLDPALAARMFPLSAVVMVVMMPIFGRMLDRFPTRVMFTGVLLSMSCAMAAMYFTRDPATALIYALVFGVNNAAVQSHYSYLWPRYFGRRHLGSIQGAAQTLGVVGASIGPLPFGIAYDLTGTFDAPLLGLITLPILCAMAVFFFLRAPRLTAPDVGGSP